MTVYENYNVIAFKPCIQKSTVYKSLVGLRYMIIDYRLDGLPERNDINP